MAHRFVLTVDLPDGHFAQAKALASLEKAVGPIEAEFEGAVSHSVEEVKAPRKRRAAG